MKQNRTKKGIKIVKWWVICVFFSSLHSTSLFFLSIALLFICRCFAQENLLTHHSVLLSWNTKTQKILRERERTEKKWMKQSCAHARVLWIGLGKHIHSRTRPSWMGKNDEENSLWRNVGVLQKVLAPDKCVQMISYYRSLCVYECSVGVYTSHKIHFFRSAVCTVYRFSSDWHKYLSSMTMTAAAAAASGHSLAT